MGGVQVLQSIARTLKKGSGRVLVRDYAEGDLAESRLAASSRQQKLQDNFYVRGDGTRAFYFSEAALLKLFLEAGYSCEKMQVHERTIENRRKGLLMDRRWIQAVFVIMSAAPSAGNLAGMLLYLDPMAMKGYERSVAKHYHAKSALPPAANRFVRLAYLSVKSVLASRHSCLLAGAQPPSQAGSQSEAPSAGSDKQQRGVEVSRSALASGHEWEQDRSDQSCECAMSQLFENGQQGEEVQEQISLPGMPDLTVCSVSRSERHTLRHTGQSCVPAPRQRHVDHILKSSTVPAAI